jgi:hypothetical protein
MQRKQRRVLSGRRAHPAHGLSRYGVSLNPRCPSSGWNPADSKSFMVLPDGKYRNRSRFPGRNQSVDEEGQLSKLYPLLSILMALALALFEFFFFFQTSGVEETTGPFGPNRLGFTLAWIALVYLSFQLLTIPLAVGGRDRFIGVVDGMASVVPFGVSLVVVFGRPELLVDRI